MKRKLISLLLVLLMIVGLFPAAAFAEEPDTEETWSSFGQVTYTESPYDEGVADGDEDVAVMVYGKAISEAVMESDYSFDDFVASLKSELQGFLANEKLPDVELYLVNKAEMTEFKLTPNAVEDAAFLSSFRFEFGGILSLLEDIIKFLQDAFGWLVSGIDTIGELYKIYGVENIPGGSYTLEVREIKDDGYTLYEPQGGSVRVTVGDDHVNYVGYDKVLGEHSFEVDLGLVEFTLYSVRFSMPGVFLNCEDPGFTFRSVDMGGNPLPNSEFLLVDRDETENLVNAALRLGKDTFTNAMALVGTEGFTWDELNALNKDILAWDSSAGQITFNEKEAYKLLTTYWALMEASAYMPLTEFMGDEANVRLPAILSATADKNGYVHFTEDSNVTLVWSLKILLELTDVVLTEIGESDFTEGLFADSMTEAIVELVLELAQAAARQGVEFWDENGELVDGVINDWVYPILMNDNIPGAAREMLEWLLEDDGEIDADIQKLLNLLPTHAILTRKMPTGHYIMLETDIPDGYLRSPMFYTVELTWDTESGSPADWCYATVGNVGLVLPYFAEEYYTLLREFDLGKAADEVLNAITLGATDTLIQDILSGELDVTATAIACMTDIIYRYMGGSYVYESEDALAQALTEYLYCYGRTRQNLIMFADQVAKEAKGVITDEIDADWNFYNFSTSRRTNEALRLKALIEGVAASIDTTGDNPVNETAQEITQEVADHIDTSNHILEQTAAAINAFENAVVTTAKQIGNALLKTALQITKTIISWGRK